MALELGMHAQDSQSHRLMQNTEHRSQCRNIHILQALLCDYVIIAPIGALAMNEDVLDTGTYTLLAAGLSSDCSLNLLDLLRLSSFESSQRFPIPSSSQTHHRQLEG